MKYPVFLLLMSLFAIDIMSGAAMAQDPPPARKIDLSIAAMPDVTGGVNDRMDGPYGIVIQTVLAEIDIPLTWRLSSPDHAYRGFYRKKFTCVAPDSKHVYPPNSGYIDATPLTIIDWIAVGQAQHDIITRPGSLYGKRVGVPYEVDAMVNVVPAAGPAYSVNSDSYQLLRQLEAGRLDIVVLTASEFRVLRQQRQHFDALSFDLSKPLASNPEGFMCHDTARGNILVTALNRAIASVGADKIRALMQGAEKVKQQ